MSVLSIRQIGDPVLRSPASPVPLSDGVPDARICRLIGDMDETMEQVSGIGLAAPQIGVSLRIFTWHVGESRGAVINPHLELSGSPDFILRADSHEEDPVLREGCLSIAGGIYAPVERFPHAVLSGVGADGEPLQIEAAGLLAACFQHELDHLDGKLFLDRLTGEHRKHAYRALRKAVMA